MSIVVDCSASAPWVLPDETTVRSKEILEQACETGVIAPLLWHFEIWNMLIVAERKGRINADGVRDALSTLSEVGIVFDSIPRHDEVLNLARTYQLSVYDATYLELAMRMQCPIATFDRKLIRASRSAGVEVVG